MIIEFGTAFVPTNSDYGHKFSTDHFHECARPLSAALVEVQARIDGAVARIVREHGVKADQVFSWRRLYQLGRLGVPALMRDDDLLPVVLAPPAPVPYKAAAGDDANCTIVLDLRQVRVRIEGQPNAAALAQVLDRC